MSAVSGFGQFSVTNRPQRRDRDGTRSIVGDYSLAVRLPKDDAHPTRVSGKIPTDNVRNLVFRAAQPIAPHLCGNWNFIPKSLTLAQHSVLQVRHNCIYNTMYSKRT